MEKGKQGEYGEDEINIHEIWFILQKRWLFICIITLISIGLAVSYLITTPDIYRITNILTLNQMQDGDLIQQSEVAVAVSVLDKIKGQNNLNIAFNNNDFKYILSIRTSEIKGSTALWVEIDATDKKAGVALMESLPDYICSYPNIYNKLQLQKTLLQKNRDDLKIIIDNPVNSLKLSDTAVIYMPSIDLYNLREKYNRVNAILDKMNNKQFLTLAWKTIAPKGPYKPRKLMIIIISLIIGLFIGTICTFLLEWEKGSGV